jgi:hypothetical protein
LNDPARVTILPGNHDRATERAYRSHRFEETFGAFMPRPTFPWLRTLEDGTGILGLDPTRSHFSPRGRLPEPQLNEARTITADPARRLRRLIVACHYPVVAPRNYASELHFKRISNDQEVLDWLAGIGPHIYCCGHVHAGWAFQPPSLPNQICLNAGAPLMRDSTGLRLPGFLEIQLDGDRVSVVHQAWSGTDWKAVPMLKDINIVASEVPTAPI